MVKNLTSVSVLLLALTASTVAAQSPMFEPPTVLRAIPGEQDGAAGEVLLEVLGQ